MKGILLWLCLLAVGSTGQDASAQFTIDTTRFAKPTPVIGAIPGLYKWANSPQSDSAVVTILSPTEGQRFNPGDSIFIDVSVSGIAIGAQTQYAELTGLDKSEEGQYLGIVLDNNSPLTSFKSGAPSFVGVATTGKHTIRVFVSRSWHESIKSDGAFKSVSILVGDYTTPGFTLENDPRQPGQPHLIFVSPRDDYLAKDAKAVLLDFIVTNVSLDPEGYKVRLSVDGMSVLLTEAVPYVVSGLIPGEHIFELEMISGEGESVEGEYNRARRNVLVK